MTEWREWLQSELKGLLREAVKRKLVVQAEMKELPPMTLTVEAQEVVKATTKATKQP